MVRMRKTSCRRGAMAVEAALILPVLLLLTFGGIRWGWLYLKAQQITNAARVGVRIAIRPDATDADVTGAIDALFGPTMANITGHTVNFYQTVNVGGTLTRSQISSIVGIDVGVAIEVEIMVPVRPASASNVDIMDVPLLTALEPASWSLRASSTMAKEGIG